VGHHRSRCMSRGQFEISHVSNGFRYRLLARVQFDTINSDFPAPEIVSRSLHSFSLRGGTLVRARLCNFLLSREQAHICLTISQRG